MENWQQPALGQSPATQLNFPLAHKNDPTRANVPADMVQDVNGTGWVRPFNYGPGIDSLLKQNPPFQPTQRFLFQNAPYVPTVLPATLQNCIGPTASAGAGPYGPYWPDGAYIPYRPAALRDSRFNSPNPFAKQLTPASLQFYNTGQQSSLNWNSVPASNHHDGGFAWNQPGLGVPNHDTTLKSNFPPRHINQKALDPSAHRTLPYHTRQHDIGPGFSSQRGESIPWSNTLGYNFPSSSAATSSRTANVEFKEKVLSWAHGVYVDLLATIHQARRNSASAAKADGQSARILKPSIYPKPPRQPGLDFSRASMPDMPRHNSYPSSQYDVQSQKPSGMTNRRQSEASSTGSHRHERPSLAHFQHGATDTQMLESLRRTGRFSSTTPASRFPTFPLGEQSTTANAASALEMLSHLCMESGWEWIDGMLLGGCLAYGLGDYHKAMRWYSRIIARDSTYVCRS